MMKGIRNLAIILLLIVSVLFWAGGGLSTTTASSTIDLTPSRDTYIHEWEPTINYGGGHDLRVRFDLWKRALLRFDTAAIPTDSTVQSARLYLYLSWYDNQPGIMAPVSVYKVNSDWTEMGATWNLRMADVPWSADGCNSSVDRSLTAAATTNVLEPSSWYSWDITALVQDWVSNPAGNQGMILINTANKRELRFHSREAATNRPYLHIQHAEGSAPGPTVTPTDTPPPDATPAQPTPDVPPAEQVSEFRVSKDSYIFSGEPNTPYEHQLLHVWGQGYKKSLLDFDVSTIPQGAQILSAELELTTFPYDDGRGWALDVGAYRLNRPWEPTQATWNVARTGHPWATAGANGIPGDREGSSASVTSVQEVSTGTSPAQRKAYTWDVASIVQAWVDNPASKAGLALQSMGGVYRDIRFIDSAYQGDAGLDMHPLLTVHWIVEVPTPTATLTPEATATATPTQTPVATATPTATVTPSGATITGSVYRDSNRDGMRNAGEPGMASYRVQLLQGDSPVQEQFTNSEGRYTLHGVQPENYILRVLLSAGDQATTPNPRPLTVVGNQVLTFDFGIAPSAGVYLPIILR
jgi:hypothetical protein